MGLPSFMLFYGDQGKASKQGLGMRSVESNARTPGRRMYWGPSGRLVNAVARCYLTEPGTVAGRFWPSSASRGIALRCNDPIVARIRLLTPIF